MNNSTNKVRVGQLVLALTISVLSVFASVSVQAKQAGYTIQMNGIEGVAESSEAITICYYRPRIYMGPAQRGFSITLNGHTDCAEQYNFGILYYVKHTYR